VIFLMGPTGAGKTDVAIELAARLPCDLISVDSALVYRGMDIGTAKPDAAVLAQAPHRLVDICDPVEPYSAARFRVDACAEIESILSQGRIPLLVGGTMLYFRALANGLSKLPAADVALRQRLERQASSEGWAAMHQRLLAVDPPAGQRIHPNDPQRILRALEVFEMTGTPMTELQGQSDPLPYRIVRLVIAPAERAVLHQRIEQRFQAMMRRGFLDEVEGLFRRDDLHADLPSMRAVGYRQLWAHLAGEVGLDTAVQQGMTATRQLAKRQLTWLRSEPGATKWFDGDDKNMLSNVLKTPDDAQ
jgi:tRNA dimethylallyltransferase